MCLRIPFFFEPNFDAHVKPLASALRLQADRGLIDPAELYKQVVYGQFLLGKVGGNFATEEGKSRD
jgi:isopenicillin N synthase-like dioxygenase